MKTQGTISAAVARRHARWEVLNLPFMGSKQNQGAVVSSTTGISTTLESAVAPNHRKRVQLKAPFATQEPGHLKSQWHLNVTFFSHAYRVEIPLPAI